MTIDASTRAVTRAIAVVFAGALALSTLAGCAVSAADGSQNTEPSAQVTVPAPGGGTVEEVVPEVAPGATQEVAIDAPAALPNGVIVSIDSVDKLVVAAETPGEIAGPAVAVTFALTNGSAEPIDVSTAMATVSGADGTFGQPTTSVPFAPFGGTIAPGGSATGVYVFLLPESERETLTATLEYIAGVQTAVFVGQV